MSGLLRAPRLLVLANGQPLPAFEAEVLSNNHYAADRFRVRAAASQLPPGLMSEVEIMLEIQASLDAGGNFTRLILGAVDTLDLDPVSGTLDLSGRDLAAGLIETRTQETFANQTASEIATTLAGRHNLEPDVQATTTPVGRYWQLEHDRIVLDQFARTTTEWDLLVTLAQFEGFDVWVSGVTLHFRPPQPTDAAPVVLRAAGPANVISLQLQRSLTLARDIEVTVKSWNSRQANAFVQRARRGGGAAAGKSGGPPQKFVYVVPNLTPDDALKLAQRRLAELTAHERVVIAEMPGELQLAPRGTLRVEATGTDFDQDYSIDRIERHISVAHGFHQTVHARNITSASTASSPADPVH